jgi:ribonuclease HI
MNKAVDNLPESTNTFHGIVPGRAVHPKGTVLLDVTFGTPEHFRTESIEFEVVDWKSQYHAILGRPTFARFMAVPHYAYLKLKMPGPMGVITVNGNFQRSDACDRDFSKISEAFQMEQLSGEQSPDRNSVMESELKKQAVATVIHEVHAIWTVEPLEEENNQQIDEFDRPDIWVLYFEGSKGRKGTGASVILISPDGERLNYILQIDFSCPSKVEADYEGLFQGMRLAKALGADEIIIRGNSSIIAQNEKGAGRDKAGSLAAYQDHYDTLQKRFRSCQLQYVTRTRNKQASKLADIGSAKAQIPPDAFFRRVGHRSIKKWHPQPTPTVAIRRFLMLLQ